MMSVLTLLELWTYPIKALGGTRVYTARVMEKGLVNDRRMMLIDANAKFMSQKFFPALTLFKTAIADNKITVYHGNDMLDVSYEDFHFGSTNALIFDDLVEVTDGPTGYNQWFSDHLHFACKLVFFPEANPRLIEAPYNPGAIHTNLSDGFPFLLISQHSLDDLNGRMESPLSMSRFRPNFVIGGGHAFQEDEWKVISIGTNRFQIAKPCARCSVPTVDPETGKTGKEPLRTLATYRMMDHKVYFGQNLVAIDHQQVSEGDTVTVQQKAPSSISEII